MSSASCCGFPGGPAAPGCGPSPPHHVSPPLSATTTDLGLDTEPAPRGQSELTSAPSCPLCFLVTEVPREGAWSTGRGRPSAGRSLAHFVPAAPSPQVQHERLQAPGKVQIVTTAPHGGVQVSCSKVGRPWSGNDTPGSREQAETVRRLKRPQAPCPVPLPSGAAPPHLLQVQRAHLEPAQGLPWGTGPRARTPGA